MTRPSSTRPTCAAPPSSPRPTARSSLHASWLRAGLFLAVAVVVLREPAHVLSASLDDPGVEAFAPAGTPAQYAPDRVIDLVHADITVFPDLVDQRVTGVVSYRAAILDPNAREITLDAVDLDVTSASIDGSPAAVRTSDGHVHVALPNGVGVDDELELSLAWSAAPGLGLYFMGPASADARARALRDGDETPPRRGLPERRLALQAWTQGEMHETRHWLPTWDYPNDRFTSSWHVVAPADMAVIANGEALGQQPVAEAKLEPQLRSAIESASAGAAAVWHFEQREDHVSYLLSMIVGRYDVVREHWRGKPVEYWVPRGRSDEARATFSETPAMLEFFSDWIGVEFPWAKYAQTTVQEFTFGGMENVSATTMTDQMLHPADLEPIADRQGLVAHELAHQWWGDLLTCREWAHVWLNEGFATYFAALWREHAEGADAFALSRRGMASGYFAEARRYRRAIVTQAYRRASSMFDRHTYPKGGWVLHMLRRELGDQDFRRAIAHYAKQNAFSLVETADLQRAIREATGRNMDRFFRQWVYGPGHPELRSSWRHDPSTQTVIVTIEQRQDQVFEFFLDLELVGAEGVVAQRVRIDRRSTQIVMPAASAPTFVLVDAGLHLLAELEQQQHEAAWLAQLTSAARGIDRVRAAAALASHDSPAVIAGLRDAVAGDSFHAVRSEAARALGAIAELRHARATEALLELWTAEQAAADKSDARVRKALLQAIARTRTPFDKAALALLVDALERDPIDHVRAAAATALTRFDGAASPDDDNQKRAAKQAAKLQARAIKALRAALEQHSFNVEVERAAVATLAAIGETKHFDLVLDCSAAQRPTFLRIAALDALMTLHEREGLLEPAQRATVAQTLAAALDDPNTRIRRAAVSHIAKLGLPDARARLRRTATHDLDSRTQEKAEDELRQL